MNDRWKYIENEGGAEGRTVFKPGWTAYEVGAKMRLVVDAEFHQQQQQRGAHGTSLTPASPEAPSEVRVTGS